MDENTNLALIDAAELSLVPETTLNAQQLQHLLKRTPKQFIKTRPAKGGGQWEYVSGGYVKKVLNLMFGFDWDFEILEQQIQFDEAIVKGRLTCRSNSKSIVKMQFGNKDIIYKKGTDKPLSIGNDLKAAATDCLKKCAAEIGIAADIYNKEEFKEVLIDTEGGLFETLTELFEIKKTDLDDDTFKKVKKIIDEKDSRSYRKAILTLKKS
jgi:hypothetical protein